MMKLRTHDRTAVFFSAVLAFAALIGTKAPADVLFRDDFNGTSLSPYWRVNPGDYLGRTYLDQAPDVGGGVATLHLDTYSPTTPGLVVRGTEIQGQDFYAQGQGLEFEARMKFDPSTPNGVVQSFYTYFLHVRPNEFETTQDEIDVELLSNQINDPANRNRLLLTNWNDYDFNANHLNDQVHMWQSNPAVAGFDPTQFNTYTIRWLPGHTQWLVNGHTVWDTPYATPDEAMQLRFNMWAPANDWQAAYSPDLQPTSDPSQNQRYGFQVDWVEVRSVPEPSSGSLFALSLAALVPAVIRTRARVRVCIRRRRA